MSRIGIKPIPVPDGVSVDLDDRNVHVKGPKGELASALVDKVIAKQQDGEIVVEPVNYSQEARSMWGLQRSLLNNMIQGVKDGFTVTLDISGVGYRAMIQGQNLVLQLGLSHDIVFPIPDGIDINCPQPTQVDVSGIDKQRVGQVAAKIRGFKPPEPYKGKGIAYRGEYVLRKEGKKK